MRVLCLKRFGTVAGIVEHLHHQTAAAGTSQGGGQTRKQRKNATHSRRGENKAFELSCATAQVFHRPCFSERKVTITVFNLNFVETRRSLGRWFTVNKALGMVEVILTRCPASFHVRLMGRKI